MIKLIKSIFKKKQTNSEEKDDAYVPSQFEMLKFYRRFLVLDYKQMIIKNIMMIISSITYARQPFVLLEIKLSLQSNEPDKLKYAIFELFATTLIRQIFNLFEVKSSKDNFRKTQKQVQKQVLQHLFSLDIQYFEENKITQISQMIKQGANSIASQLNYNDICGKIQTYIYFGGQVYFIYKTSPIILASMFVLGFIGAFIEQIIKAKEEENQKLTSEQNEFQDFALDDILNNIQVIKTFGTENKEMKQLEKIQERNSKNYQESTYLSNYRSIISNSTLECLKIMVILQIFYRIGLSENNSTLASSVTEIISYVYCIIKFSDDITQLLVQKQEGYFEERKKYIGKIMELFKVIPKIDQGLNDKNNNYESLFEGNITFENVSFTYPKSKNLLAEMNQKKNEEQTKSNNEDKSLSSESSLSSPKLSSKENLIQNKEEQEKTKNDQDEIEFKKNESNNSDAQSMMNQNEIKQQNQDQGQVLHNISFTIKKGQLVSFVGKSGCGKSTIIKLIQRYYDVNSGNILFDNQNIKDVSLSKIRRSIGLVSQEPSLFDNDIEYNITYGCKDGKYTQQELRNICDISGVSEFVFDESRFPKGLKTLVGSKGTKLSGGQKQRIAIARALIKKPKILILDEATSSLDSESESIVQNYIDKLVGYKGMTIIVIAHRLSTVINSDIIYVMKHGQIKESGNHSYLVSNGIIYPKLIHNQINFTQNKL